MTSPATSTRVEYRAESRELRLGSWKRRALVQRAGDVEIGRLLYPETAYWRPKTRGDCVEGIRPCPFVACRYHLYVDVDHHANINVAPMEPWDMSESCALDVAERGPHDLREIADVLHMSAERVRQIETSVLWKLRRRNALDPSR